jgi:murein DD-endopeptidase MepM/ murein hydrolase activator NlpD
MRLRPRAVLGLSLAIAGCVTAEAHGAQAEPPPPVPPLSPPADAPVITPVSSLAAFNLQGVAEQGGLVRGRVPRGTASLALDGMPVPFVADGAFIIGFGRDAEPSAMLEAQATNGARTYGPITVQQRAWNIQSLPTLPKGTTPTPAFLARRKLELEQIAAARATESGSEGWRQHFIWPATGRISGVFGSQRIYAGEPGDPHGGVDVARPTGTQVVAPADGVVILAAPAPFTLEGNLLMIDHGMGLNSAFLHLSRIDVHVGEAVRQGQSIGAVGMTGRATGPHLHWAMKWRDVRIDPAPIAGAMPKSGG